MIFNSHKNYLFSPKYKALFYIPWVIFLIFGCGENQDSELRVEENYQNEPKTKVVVTTTQLRDLVQFITKDRFSITSLMGPGVDPHIYKATSKDILALSKADLVIFHGMDLEGRLSDALTYGKKNGILTFSATSTISHDSLIFPDEPISDETHADPHVWFDPKIWSFMVSEFTTYISEFDPERKTFFKRNALRLQQEIDAIENWAMREIKKIPENQRTLVTSHDAFQYLGRAFGLKVVGLQGISTTSEAGLGDRANLVDLIRKQNIPAIFIESSVNPGAIEEIAKECEVVVGGKLFSDALGSGEELVQGPNGNQYYTDTWAGMMVHNINTIVSALTKEKK